MKVRVSGLISYHVPLAPPCVYGCSNERGENGDGKDRSKSSGGGEREII